MLKIAEANNLIEMVFGLTKKLLKYFGLCSSAEDSRFIKLWQTFIVFLKTYNTVPQVSLIDY